jgi:hypothetical protein
LPAERAALDAELRALHGAGSPARLSTLHERAAEFGDAGTARFHLTHAWVFALVAGDAARIAALETRLRAAGGL